eukprot:11240409-Alexandrium_andersonii.AAC.1
MSASLVGSEMCIRDSLAAAGALLPDDLAQLADAFVYYVDLEREEMKIAVSYTHLTLPTICSV